MFDWFRRIVNPKQGWLTREKFKSSDDSEKYYLAAPNFNFNDYCNTCDRLYNYTKIRSGVLTVAGQVRGEGVYVRPATNGADDKGSPKPNTQDLAAHKLVEKLNQSIAINQLVFDTAKLMTKYGTCFWEKTYTPTYNVQMINPRWQKHIRPDYDKKVGDIKRWIITQNPYGSVDPDVQWRPDEVVVFAFDRDAFTPYGTSLIYHLKRITDSIDDTLESILEYSKRGAFGTDIVQIGDDTWTPGDNSLQKIKQDYNSSEVGGPIWTNMPIDAKRMGAGTIQPTMIPELIKLLNDEITDNMLVPPISKLYSSTQASAIEMTDWSRANLIIPVQEVIKEKIENEVYWPLLEDAGFSRRSVPRVTFNPPEAGRLDESKYWLNLVLGKVVSPRQAAEELGFMWDEEYWKEYQETPFNMAGGQTSMKQNKEQPSKAPNTPGDSGKGER